MKQPLFNSTYKSFTKRDTLGLQNISSTIQAWVCPIVNVVTPHPFYWAFLIWNYYHFYSQPENKNLSDDVFNKDFVKRNDFFFILSNHISGNNMDGIVGRDNISSRFKDKTFVGPYKYDSTYYQSRFGGMQYYNYGCQVMKFIIDKNKIDINDDSIGAQLTRAFDSAIQNTSVYKKYISKNERIDNLSRDELIELSRCLSLDMKNMDEVKELIYNALFNVQEKTGNNSKLLSIENYLRMLIEAGLLKKGDSFYGRDARRVLFGEKEPMIFFVNKISGPKKNTITRWELVIANQYYVACMEMIWKFILSKLTIPCAQDEWINIAISDSKKIDIDAPLSSIKSDLSFDQIEDSITNNIGPNTIYSALSVLMTLYNRFKGERISDFDCIPFKVREGFCAFSLILRINNGDFKTVGNLLNFILKTTIIERHETIATKKRYQGRDGFLYEKVYDRYHNRGSEYTNDVNIPSLRISNVLSVLRDLGKIDV